MGGKTSTSTQSVSIPPEVLARYNAVNARAEQVAATPFQAYGGQFVAPLSPTQQAGIQATNVGSQAAQPYYGAATGLTLSGAQDVGALTPGQIGYYQNPYTEAVAAPTYQALRQQQGEELARQQAAAIRAGAYGGDRAGIQRANLQRQQQLGLAQAIAPIYQQGYQQAVQTAAGQQGVVAQDLARRMQAGQQIAGLGTGAQQAALQGAQAQLAAGAQEQQTQQADLTARYQQFLQERGYPFQVAQFLANIAMGTGALSGSTTTTTQPAPFFSDVRLKHDVERIGETDEGLPIYSYKYNGDDRTQVGLMAQDVEKVKPEAVGLAPASDGNLYKTVDYEKATRKGRDLGGEVMDDDGSSMGGAVDLGAAMEAFARGGYAVGGGGGLLSDTDLKALLANAGKQFGPNAKSGIYGQDASALPFGKSDIVPAAGLHIPKMIKPASGTLKAPVSQGAEAVTALKQGYDIYNQGKGLAGDLQKMLTKQTAATGGLIVDRHGYQGDGFVTPGQDEEGQEKPVENRANVPSSGFPSKVLESGAHAAKLITAQNKPGQPPSGASQLATGIGLAKSAMDLGKGAASLFGGSSGAGAASGIPEVIDLTTTVGGAGGAAGGTGLMASIGEGLSAIGPAIAAFFSDARLKDNIRPVGLTFDGQNIYAYDMGDGRTQLGLMAQEVLDRKPEAVGERDGFLTLDYDKATEDATPRATGGLVPRQHHANGEEAVLEERVTETPTETTETVTEKQPVGLVAAPQAAPKEEPKREAPSADDVINRAAAITRQKESGNKYDIVGPVIPSGAYKGDRPYGAYQVMGNNVGPWTEKYLGRRMTPDEFLKDNQAQDDLFKAVWGENYRKHGNVADAVSIWASGVPLAQGADRRDLVFGTRTGDYVNDFMRRMEGKEGRPQPPGLVGGSARRPAMIGDVPAREAGLGDVARAVLPEGIPTNASFWVPALGAIGSMLSSKSPYLAGAIGEGLVGGVGAYQSQQKQENEMAKGVLDLIKDRFSRGTDENGNTVFFDKILGRQVSADQVAGVGAGMLRSRGINPETYGFPASTAVPSVPSAGGPSALPAPTAPAAPGAAPPAGAAPAQTAEVTAPKPGEPAKTEGKSWLDLPPDQVNLFDKSETQLVEYAKRNPGYFGLTDDRDPRKLQAEIDQRRRAATNILRTGDPEQKAAAQASLTLANEEQKRLDGYLKEAVALQVEQNKELAKASTLSAGKFEEGIAARADKLPTTRNDLIRLADIFANYEPGRPAAIKASLESWFQGTIGYVPSILKGNTVNYDEALKLALKEAFTVVGDNNMSRAPKAALLEAVQTVPNPSMDPGAAYALIGRTIGEMDYVNQRDQAYMSGNRGMPPARFLTQFNRDNPKLLNETIANSFQNVIPVGRNVTEEQRRSLGKTYGFDPKPIGQTGRQAAPAAPAAPEVGTVMQGYRFNGGNPADSKNWTKVQ